MTFGVIGLGRMGLNVAQRALETGHEVVGFDVFQGPRADLMTAGGDARDDLESFVATVPTPRVILLYVPHGAPTEVVCSDLMDLLGDGDVVCDCGNSHWEDAARRADLFARRGIGFLDIGTSGGVDGARNGAAFMVGGSVGAFARVKPLLLDLAVDPAAVHFVGPSGSGHFVKLVHNAIEFGMIQSIAEGVELLLRSDFDIDLPDLFEHWNHGSVIRSWLVDLMGRALREGDLTHLSTYVEDTGEVKWILQWAMEQDIPTPAVSTAQTALMSYRDVDWPTAKAVALLRNAFGGHPVHEGAAQGA